MNTERLLEYWPALAACASFMIVGAVIDGWKLKVPNRLTYSMIVSAWVYWVVQGVSPLGLSLAGTFIAGALLLVPYSVGGMGAGDVKLYAGFGAWMAPISWFGITHIWWSFVISVVLGSVMAVIMIAWKRTPLVNLENAKEILNDFQTSSSIAEISEKARQRKPRLQLLPYGVPLTIGSLGYLGYMLQGAILFAMV